MRCGAAPPITLGMRRIKRRGGFEAQLPRALSRCLALLSAFFLIFCFVFLFRARFRGRLRFGFLIRRFRPAVSAAFRVSRGGIEECFNERSPAALCSHVTQSLQTDVLCVSLVLTGLNRLPAGSFLPRGGGVRRQNMWHLFGCEGETKREFTGNFITFTLSS